MIQIEDMQLAAALLREPSLSAAARSLDVTPPALSMRLRKLEATLGLSLATRTARRLSLTAEGERFAREAAALLGQIEGLRESMQRDDRRLTGTLRIAAPFGYGRQYVAPMLARFARLHPGLRIQFDLRETPWPDRHDADAIIHIGTVRDSSWIARTLSANARWLCASPEYLRARGTPRVPRDVMAHDCIVIRENDEDVTLWHVRRAAKPKALRRAGRARNAAHRAGLRHQRRQRGPALGRAGHGAGAALRVGRGGRDRARLAGAGAERLGSSTAHRSCCWCRPARDARRACRR
jgi:DNA-binding transcriptional LysR family regulator